MANSLVKFRCKVVPNIVILDDGTVWREPFVSKRKDPKNTESKYGWKEIKPYVYSGRIYYCIRQKRVSQKQLNEWSVPSIEWIDIPARNPNVPFPDAKTSKR